MTSQLLALAAGIDVGQRFLDVGLAPSGKTFRVPNAAEGIVALVERLTQAGIGRVVLEAIGPYARQLVSALAVAGFEVGLINPRRIKAFGEFEGRRAKTDRLDARLIARFALAMTDAIRPLPTAEQLARFKQQNVALTPTLTLFAKLPIPPEIAARIVDNIVSQLKGFSDNGSTVLFGTDVGYIPIYDTTLEFELMHRALSERQVLASLTTNPAAYFRAAKKGRVEQGFDADLVILDGDPVADVRNLAKVATTIRAGQVIYQKP